MRESVKDKQAWTNRIVRYGEEAPDQLLAHEMNAFKIHPKGQQDAMAGMLNETGWLAPVIVSELSGKVIDGHMRVSLAISRNEPSVPVAYVRLTPEEEVAALATFDPVGALVAYDREQLDALLREVQSGDAAVQAMLAELAASQAMSFGETSTTRAGQGVSSTWDQVASSDNQKVVLGDIETRLPADVMRLLQLTLETAYEQERKPIHETLEIIIVAGVRAFEAVDCR